jgi:hypothetical protein
MVAPHVSTSGERTAAVPPAGKHLSAKPGRVMRQCLMFGKTGNVSLDRRVCRKGDEADRERAVTPSGAVRSSSEEKAIGLVAGLARSRLRPDPEAWRS